ncbi:MAG: hypothetical protein EoVTN8_97 [Fluviibacter phosphoraccumulans EoVTN8]
MYVSFRKTLLVIVKEFVSVETICECGETATGYSGDDINMVDYPRLFAAGVDKFGPVQGLQNAIRKGGSTCATTGKSQCNEGFGLGFVLTFAFKRVGFIV